MLQGRSATFKPMNQRPDSRVPAYDPFGEPVEASEVMTDDRRVRIAAVAVFWTLATLLTAGRIYNGDQPFALTPASAPAQLAALSTTAR